jgi:ADP-dependent NAD(P)H-hydrate dehydratase
MSEMRILDAQWRAAHPLRAPDGEDKNDRGRVLLAGGSHFVPGALALTFEAAMRVGAGKVQIATVEAAAIPLGVRLPEAAVTALPTGGDGELATAALTKLEPLVAKTDCLVVGCGMIANDATPKILQGLLEALPPSASAVVDAGAIVATKQLEQLTRTIGCRLVFTPNHGEAAGLLGVEKDTIVAAPQRALDRLVKQFGATFVLKARTSLVGSPTIKPVRFINEGTGLGTAGSGDVLAGVLGGLLSQGVDPAIAAGWAVWLHAKAGQAAARRLAPVGFLARELAVELSPLLAEARRSGAN